MPDMLATDIPYEHQSDPMSNRMCGPAALCMVYRSFGIDSSQAELAAKVTRAGPTAAVGALTYLLAQDALARGLGAIVVRARDPIRALRSSQNGHVRLILNHRLRLDSPLGHFTVVVGVGKVDVVVHDPLIGPDTRLLQSELLELWQPLGAASEITGNVLVAVAKEKESPAPCPRCRTVLPDAIDCPRCGKPIALRPATALGCFVDSCPERNWDVVFCPHCDCSVADASGKTVGQAPPRTPAETDDDPFKVQPLNQEIDKFIGMLLATNNGQPVPGAAPLLTQIRGLQKEMLAWQEKDAAQRRAKATAPPPPPPPPPAPPPKPPERKPVDWNALGVTLLGELDLLDRVAIPTQPGTAPAEPAAPRPTSVRRPETAEEYIDYLRKRGLWR